MKTEQKIIELKNISLGNRNTDILSCIGLGVNRGDSIGIYGRNGSGKSVLAEIIAGKVKPSAGTVVSEQSAVVSVVSSEEKKRMLDEDRYNDDTDFMQGALDPGRSVNTILREKLASGITEKDLEDYIIEFKISGILNRGIRFLSTGEFRKMMLVRALCEKPDLLVLDDPFTGLDIGTRKELEELLPGIREKVGAIMILSGRKRDFGYTGINRGLILENGRLGEASDIGNRSSKDGKAGINGNPAGQGAAAERGVELIRMESVKLSYYDERILSDINWQVFSGEHWQITGPNGSGKSTLLSLINGDSPKAYGQQLYLFGKKRGSGETVWDIRKQIGTVSGSLQQSHRINQNVLSVVVSGFFDTIGLYDKPSPVQLEKAEEWCKHFDLDGIRDKSFSSLSEGMKRAVLVVRAVIKHPRLMILDEPCQGLDDYNSDFVLNVARTIMETNHSTLLYVSHDPDYIMEGITNRLELVPHPEGGYTGTVAG